jgi:hypothetical protein
MGLAAESTRWGENQEGTERREIADGVEKAPKNRKRPRSIRNRNEKLKQSGK